MGLPPTSYPRTPPVRRRGLLPCSPLGMHRTTTGCNVAYMGISKCI